jgi:hypothetical protein
MEYKAKLGEALHRIRIYDDNLVKLYALIWERCNTAMQGRLEQRTDCKSTIYNDPIERLQAIKEHGLADRLYFNRGGPKLSWTSNPGAIFTDWRVKVCHKESSNIDVYNLHRNIVGFGPRKSNFLMKAFVQKGKNFDNENNASVTRLDVPDS